MGNHKSNIENLVSDCNIYSISYRAHASSLFNAITFGKSNLVSTGVLSLFVSRGYNYFNG